MDYEVVWPPAAFEDVESLADYIAKDSEFYAGAVVDNLLDTARRLKDFPLAGRIVTEIEDKTGASKKGQNRPNFLPGS